MNPGIHHGVSERDYHALQYVSKSKLWAFDKNPYKWRYGPPKEETDAMRFGSLVDCLWLTPDKVAENFAISPYDDFRKNEAKAWRDSQTATVIKRDQYDKAQAVVGQLISDDFLYDMIILASCKKQVTIICEGYHESGLFLGKARPDIDPAGEWLFDLKTTSDLGQIENTIADFGYHAQAAWYLDMYNGATGSNTKIRFGFIFIETEPPFDYAIREIDEESIGVGRAWYRRALDKWLACHASGKFPSPYQGEIKTIGLPKWAKLEN